MGVYHFPGIGLVHVNEARRPKVIPVDEKHKWAAKITWGQTTTCVKCGCIKHIPKFSEETSDTFQMPGGPVVNERPACTGGTKSAQLTIPL